MKCWMNHVIKCPAQMHVAQSWPTSASILLLLQKLCNRLCETYFPEYPERGEQWGVGLDSFRV